MENERRTRRRVVCGLVADPRPPPWSVPAKTRQGGVDMAAAVSAPAATSAVRASTLNPKLNGEKRPAARP